MAQARVAKFYVQVEYIKCWPWDDKLPHDGCRWGHVTRLKYIFAPFIQ